MRYRFRRPFKVTPEKLALMRERRTRGASFRVAADFVGVSPECARKWLRGLTPVRP